MKYFLPLLLLSASCATKPVPFQKKNRFAGGITVYDWGKDRIEIEGTLPLNVKPIGFHFKDDGSTTDKPVLAIVSIDAKGFQYVSKISFAMLEPVLKKIEEIKRRNGIKNETRRVD